MKKLNLLFTALLLMCYVGTAKAVEVTIDGIKYDVITKAKQATVISGGNCSGNIVIPETIEHDGVTCSVTSIGYATFAWCSGLTSITIPNSVKSIGESAFYYCTGLKEVHINDLAAWCNIDFESYDANPLYYARNLYLNNELVTELIIPNSVTSIGDLAFYGCSGLTSITIPNSVKSIGGSAFNGCSGLTSVTIGNSVTSIGNYAFAACYGLTSITIGNSVTSIGQNAFYACSGLKEVHINDIVAWCNIDFGNYDANPLSCAHNLYLNNELITELIIPNGVTSIKNYAFWRCSGLTSVTIPNSVTSIGKGAFAYCSGLTSITIPNSVTSIGNSAFEDCDGLTSITIPNSVTSIGDGAFSNCSNLTDVYCLATNVPSTNSNAFSDSYPEYMTLHVPAEAINSYKTTAPWSSFGNIVTLDGDIVEPEVPEEPEVKICATPTISYSNGKIAIECETDGAEFITTVTNMYSKTYYTNIFDLSATYNISVYAMANGYDNSDTVNATLSWIENGNIDNETNVINIPATAVFITSRNGELSINCALDGESVEVYTTGGALVGTTTIANGNATIQTALSKGSVAIIKVGNKSVKAIID